MRGSSRISTTGRSIARAFLPSGRTPATSVGASENRRIRPPASPPSDRSGRSVRSAHKPRPADRPMRRRSFPIPVRRPGRPQAACPAIFQPARRKARPYGPARSPRPEDGSRSVGSAKRRLRRHGHPKARERYRPTRPSRDAGRSPPARRQPISKSIFS